eukprot:scpid90001/ scgid6650/ Carbonyl reductase family member 4; 3-oxoacyl-[acyl-carrier-protein] reductase; Quinone reductase CBR4
MLKPGGAVIFGGSRGIGRAIAFNLAEKGYTVAVVSRNGDQCLAAAAELPKAGTHIGLACDLSKPDEIQASCADIEKRLDQPIHVLVNSAGVVRDAVTPRIQLPDIHAQVNTNLIGPMITCKHFSTVMMKQRYGCIINIGSVIGSMGNSGQSVYSASKAGLVGFTKSVAKELVRYGIRANLIEPGFIHTDMTQGLSEQQKERIQAGIPLNRFGLSQEVADAALFLVESSYTTGQVFKVDGGLSLQF